MSRWMGVTALAAGAAVLSLGCAQQPVATATVADRTYTVTPASVSVKAGIITDTQGKPIALEDARAEPVVKFSSYGGNERLDPGQDTSQSLDVEFPAEALKARRLEQIRLELAYVPSAYQEQTVNFTVSIGDGK